MMAGLLTEHLPGSVGTGREEGDLPKLPSEGR